MGLFQSGGTVREGSIYVERRADDDLPEALARGEFCYVLAPRQMGKSSLRVRTETVLRKQGICATGVDLTALGSTGVTAQQWYFGIVDELSQRLGLDDPVEFWQRHARLSAVHRWSRYLKSELLGQVTAPVVIFLDEIDVTQSLPFSDDFFASIRSLYNARVDDPTYSRLTFCMMGVATPTELVHDITRTPFNVGRGIRLEDFTREEALIFLRGLQGIIENPEPLLHAVMEWTEGHPYMTQRICEVLARDGMDQGLPVRVHVARVVGELFLTRGRMEDLSLSAVERLFARDRATPLTIEMLALYSRLLEEDHVLAVSDDPVQAALRLTGIAAERDDGATVWVRVRNPIIASVFDQSWAQERIALIDKTLQSRGEPVSKRGKPSQIAAKNRNRKAVDRGVKPQKKRDARKAEGKE